MNKYVEYLYIFNLSSIAYIVILIMQRFVYHFGMSITANVILRREELNIENSKNNSRFCENFAFWRVIFLILAK